jgi:3-methylcrotonyl-CoA carboxylase beta subunit
VFPDREHFGRIFYNQATLSAPGIPQIACVMGSCTAGGAYVPAMSRRDRHRARAGHDLPRRPAAGEGGHRRGGHAEDLGGGDVHTAQSGVVDHLAEDDDHALAIGAAHRRRPQPRKRRDRALRAAASRRYDPAEIYGVVPPTFASPTTCAR